MNCSSCEFQNRPGVRFCEQCGQSLEAQSSDKEPDEYQSFPATLEGEECPSCGFSNRGGVIFCEDCGSRLTKNLPQSQSVRTVQPKKSISLSKVAGLVVLGLFIGVAGLIGLRNLAVSQQDDNQLITNPDSDRNSGLEDDGEEAFSSEVDTNPVEPILSVNAVQTILEDSAIRKDPEIVPWLEITFEDDEGTVYNYDGVSWRAVTPGGDLWSLPGSTAKVLETQTEVQVSNVDAKNIEWVREVLDDTPGLTRSGENYLINDFVTYRDGLIKASSKRGILGVEFGSGSFSMSRPQPTSYVWVEPADDHIWLIDQTAAVLVVESGEELAVAGRLVPDEVKGAVWEPAPNTEILSGSVNQVFSNIEGVVEQNGRKKIPFKVFIPGETPPVIQDKIPTDAGPTLILMRQEESKKEECSWWKCVKSAVGDTVSSLGSATASGLEKGWNGTVNKTGQALDKLTWTNVDCLTGVIGGAACTLAAGEITVDVTEAVWEVRGNVFAEKNCGSPGPGRGSSGDPKNYKYPKEKGAYSLDGISTPFTQDWPEQLELARLWMPLIELSKEEQCGEILRVFAKVHAYGPDGEQVNSLSRADRVEIVYTLFFKEDGGRFQILGKDHPGDNEGFVIGLVRTNQSSGLCSTGFEFVAGRTVAHSDVGGPVVEYFEINKRQIDDFDSGDVGSGCPKKGDSRYRLLVAEAKHATYYHRNVCERALTPNLPVLVGGLIAGGEPLSGSVNALIVDALVKRAPKRIRENLQNGLEECESGRGLIDLTNRVELFAEELRSFHSEALGFNNTFQTEEGSKSFEEAARGRWCFGPDASSLPRVPNCDYNYHIPGFFNYSAAEIGIIVPPVKNLTEDEARVAVESLGLRLQVTPQLVDHPNSAGLVLTQKPEAGSEVAKGSSVMVRVGVYKEVLVPDVFGSTPAEARDLIEAQELIYFLAGTVELSSEDASLDGLVVDQKPEEGIGVVPGMRVQVYVGSYEGPAMVSVPYLIGETESQARAIASGRGLSIRVVGKIPGSSGNVGRVVDQEPSSGTIADGSMIDVWLGSASTVLVPDLGGLTESVARERVEDAGLVYQKAGTMQTSDSMVGRVVDQDPISGTVPIGSTIRVWIGVATPTEPPPSFPAKKTSTWVSVSITGGHGSIHRIGDSVNLCFTWAKLAGEPQGRWELWDFQPPGSSGVQLYDGSMVQAGSDCLSSATITAPTGYEEIVIVALEYDYSTNSWKVKDWANVWIYVTE